MICPWRLLQGLRRWVGSDRPSGIGSGASNQIKCLTVRHGGFLLGARSLTRHLAHKPEFEQTRSRDSKVYQNVGCLGRLRMIGRVDSSRSCGSSISLLISS